MATRRVEFDGKITVYPEKERPKRIVDRDGPRKVSRTTDGETCFSSEVELSPNAAVTLWDAASNPVGGWKWAIIEIDPDDEFADDDANACAAIDFTADGVGSPAIVIRREAPFIISSVDAGGPNTGAITSKAIDGTITQFRAWNHRNQPNVNVIVRLTLLK